MKFRKKPIEIEAFPVREAIAHAQSGWVYLPEWVRSAYEAGVLIFTPVCIYIHTLEGNMRGEIDDWIIRGINGEIYPCKPDIFKATYDEVEANGQ